jgi:hypothetical protein
MAHMDQGQEQPLDGTVVYSSWSGGKDSAYALHLAIQAGAKPGLLVTMLTETGLRSRSHGLSRELLLAQADAVGVPIHFEATSWDGYEEAFVRAVGVAATKGLHTGATRRRRTSNTAVTSTSSRTGSGSSASRSWAGRGRTYRCGRPAAPGWCGTCWPQVSSRCSSPFATASCRPTCSAR